MSGTQHEAGFTLIELMAVLVITAAALAFAAPRLAGTRAGLQSDLAAASIAETLLAARTKAMTSGRPATVVLSPAAGQYWIAGTAGRRKKLPGGVAMSVPGAEAGAASTQTLTFQPAGSATDARITLTGRGQQTVITVDWLTGRTIIRRARRR